MYVAGIDLGTTTVSIILMDAETGMLKGRRTIAHHSFLPGLFPGNRVQDPQKIAEIAIEGLRDLVSGNKGTGLLRGIGLTGQMHGMLYVDRCGNAVSPLYTWQDRCGDRILPSGESSAGYLSEHVGNAAAGYGITTHYYLGQSGLIPEDAVYMTTISDYLAMKLCGNTVPVIASDMAASWGCYDLQKGEFLTDLLEDAGVDISCLPRICKRHEIIGVTPEGVPVLCSLGDNQASVVGSVQDLEHSVLLNIGTGSQVTMGCDRYYDVQGSIELRPCVDGTYIMAGSGLCGGRAYAMLEQFFAGVKNMAEDGREEMPGPEADLYGEMNRAAEQFLDEYGKEAAWQILPTFSGTRSDPSQCGRIDGIRVDNFLPGAMTAGMLLGILEELHGYFNDMCAMTGKKPQTLIGSGNGLRKNPLMRRLAEEMFGLKMMIPAHEEEAACGAALCVLAATGTVPSIKEAQKKIHYL